MNQVFTAEQKAKLEAAKQARRAEWQARKAQGQTGQGQRQTGESRKGWLCDLNLTEAQKTQIETDQESCRNNKFKQSYTRTIGTNEQLQKIEQNRQNKLLVCDRNSTIGES